METGLKIPIRFILNNSETELTINPYLTLLDVLRKQLHLTGTKEGCREGDCGACTVLIGELQKDKVKYFSANSCLLPVHYVNGKHIVTIEGLNDDNLNLIQNQFIEEGASQCGFCTPGFILSLTGAFLSDKQIEFIDIVDFLDGNICRCTGHQSIIHASQKVYDSVSLIANNSANKISELIKLRIIPEYFLTIPIRLNNITIDDIYKTDKSVFNISGGTDLYVKNWEEIYNSQSRFISKNHISSDIVEKDGKCFIGAKATITDFIESDIIKKYFPQLTIKLKLFGSLPIRNLATIGGNIVNASPIADMVNILLALNSSLILKNNQGERTVLLRDFYKGYKTFDLNVDELIDNINFHLPNDNYFFNYEKVSKRTYLDIASVNTTIYLQVSDNIITNIFLSAGGVAPIPLLLKDTCAFLSNKEITLKNIKHAVSIAQKEISPISDARGSANYKSLLLRRLIYSHFITLFPHKVTIADVE